MSDVVINVVDLYKKYMLGKSYSLTLRETLASLVKSQKNNYNEFWALKNISFEVKRGEIIGVIGKNGAGKSTLLKILSRITFPTRGKAVIKGKVSSLLEVGTGFHPELTGRENIFLNGVMLGMSKSDIKCALDEIVHFSGIEKFIDTPVKRFSSGMYVRLAFSIAAHLRTDILLLDEVLSVGDEEFQRRCFNKVDGFTKSGKTVILVSHNMIQVENICDRVIYLKNGIVEYNNGAREGLELYLNHCVSENSLELGSVLKRCYFDYNGNPEVYLNVYSPVKLVLIIDGYNFKDFLRVDIGVNNQNGIRTSFLSAEYNMSTKNKSDILKLSFFIKNIPFYPGQYNLDIYLENQVKKIAHYKGVSNFFVVAPQRFISKSQNPGVTLLDYSSNVE